MIGKSGQLWMAGVALLAITTAGALGQPRDDRPGPRGMPGMQGADMMTAEERAAFCARMRESRTPEEREAIMRGMHDQMRARAQERGMPAPAQGQGYGRGGMYEGMGCGPMMDGGSRGPTGNRGGPGRGDGAPAGGAGPGPGPGPAKAAPSSSVGDGVNPPVERTANGLAYLSGGIGADEAAAMRGMADRYSLRLTFSGKRGEFLADVQSRIYRLDGKQVFAAVSDGPFLYVRLPPGSYRVVASWEGAEKSAQVTVPAKGGVACNLSWPS